MKTFVSLAACFTAALVLASALIADDKAKEVTLKGTLMCAKCTLNQTSECTTAIQVKEGDKLVTYLLDDKGAGEEHHEPICGGAKKEGTVVGTVSEKEGKKYIKPSKVTYAK
jgi:Family of unknown function (DUF6370)